MKENVTGEVRCKGCNSIWITAKTKVIEKCSACKRKVKVVAEVEDERDKRNHFD